MDPVVLSLAVGAGMLAALNPCGFALLPAWLTLVVERTGADDRRQAVARAVGLAAAMTLGFVVVFGTFGALVVPLALSLERYLPWVTVVIGLALVVGGAVLASGRELTVRLPRFQRAPTGGWLTMAGYGAAYALASLSCTVAPFLAVLASTSRASGFGAGLAVVVAYAVGMGLLVGVLAVAVALAQGALVARLRSALPWVSRVSGVLLLVAGAYVAWYGWYEIRVLGAGSTDDVVVDAALGIQSALASSVDRIGPRWLGAALVVLLVFALVARRGFARRP
ncbi:MAG: cytochrome c biogenesis protein CcdA [Knoellia sp.]